MNAKDILQSIINPPDSEADKFDIEKFIKFFRAKNDKLEYPNVQLDYKDAYLSAVTETAQAENNFSEGKKLAEGKLTDGELIVCSFLVNKELTERSGKKAQYTLGKKILKEQQADAGIFIFYDSQGNFRFSLIYTNYLGKRRDWSNFKRFTYFVSKELTNKTFLKQIGEGDFSSLQKIKEAFSVDPVTKQFYNEIQSWYFWSMDKIKFPDDYKYNTDSARDKEIRNATNLIRLITRIIFIWFLTKKDLVPLDLFLKEKLKGIVKDFMKDKNASNFYNAVLQNLFFGTLNQKMNERNFAGNEGYPANRKEYGIKNLYRYADKFLISKDEVLKLFEDIPFLNGGLFDCLDKENEAEKVIYVDGFSRNPAKQSIIPDYLFFQEDEEMVDLSEYGLGKRAVRGLIEILNSYNFIVDENTPIDQEIALDPELLGKVFENLLASYNPETATSARKSTGSYYTPREIVDYMVEASLFEYLKGKLPETEEKKIKMLLSYSEEIPEFSNEEKQKVISAIDEIKILDPACGSGAFPMGVLHKLVFALQKLDPENKYWRELQYQKALKESEEVFKQDDKNQREERLKEINETFDEGINYPDYARKLYLIENCIYGVDIQPIAIQISKLRFFISLVLDQKVDGGKENFGIKALPNLETRFVAANTLIGLDKPQHLFYTDKIKKLEDDIKSLRHKYFTAKTRSEKLNCQEKDKELRKRLAKELKNIGFSSDSSEKIAKFDLYDQNASADFFDPEWMFGIKDGFDVVIANPPYLEARSSEFSKQMKYEAQKWTKLRWGCDAEFITRGSDLLIYFLEIGIYLLSKKGTSVFITQNSWLDTNYGKEFQKFLLKNTNVKAIIDTDFKYFDSKDGPNINTVITIFFGKNPELKNSVIFARYHENFEKINHSVLCSKIKHFNSQIEINQFEYTNPILKNIKWGVLISSSEEILQIFSILEQKGSRLNELSNYKVTIGQGLNLKKSFIVDEKITIDFPFISKHLIPFMTTKDGAPFVLRKTKYYIVNGEKLNKSQLNEFKSIGIEIFFPESTSKIKPLLILPRGISKHFCAINSISAYSSSFVDIYDEKGNFPKEDMLNLWLFLNSSIGYLIRELNGRKNLGGGLLKAEATDLKDVPLYFNFDKVQDIKNIYEKLKNRQALPTIDEIDTEEHRRIDEIVFYFLGISKRRGEMIINYLKTKIFERIKKSKT